MREPVDAAGCKRVCLTFVSDPMMGLAWECEPVLRRLETHFGEIIEIRHAMSVLVRNVADFVDPSDLPCGLPEAIRRYLPRLAAIYLQEELIGGMPISVDGLALFDEHHVTSRPLCLAVEAARLAAPGRADAFLYALRRATIAETRPTTRLDELLAVVENSGIDRETFTSHFNGGTALAALSRDERFALGAGLMGLPGTIAEYGGDVMPMPGVLTWERAMAAIERLSDGKIAPSPPEATPDALKALLRRHPALHSEELRAAFRIESPAALRDLVRPLVLDGTAVVREASRGWFLERRTGPAKPNAACDE